MDSTTTTIIHQIVNDTLGVASLNNKLIVLHKPGKLTTLDRW